MAEQFDALVIGSGQGGNPLVAALADAGWNCAMVEEALVGGTCVNVGCTPTKTMWNSARVAYLARRAADYGVNTGPISLDMPTVRARKQSMVDLWRSGSERSLQREHLELIRGHARFSGQHTVEVNGRELQGRVVVIDTGCRPARPDMTGLDSVPTLDSTSIMELNAVPEHLIVLGGGYIGIEFGQMFRRFGSRVTIVHRGPRLLSREDADVADGLAQILKEDGINLELNARVARIAPGIRIDLEGGGTIAGSHLLVATGRTPNTELLNAPAGGVELDRRGFITVNERLQTTAQDVYAIGDVNGGPAFTHISYDDFRVLKRRLLDGDDATTTARQLPYCVFSDPMLGRIGMSETEARDSGRPIRVARLNMSRVARAAEASETRGFMKAVVDAETERILGAAVLGFEGGELMAVFQTAMMGNLPYSALRDAVWAHPTNAEALNNLFGYGFSD
ncbi:MAG TPA: mercuric reductase [Chloroflexota bacterium]|nr:mercuric reductase [Chloroflexota bacterium]